MSTLRDKPAPGGAAETAFQDTARNSVPQGPAIVALRRIYRPYVPRNVRPPPGNGPSEALTVALAQDGGRVLGPPGAIRSSLDQVPPSNQILSGLPFPTAR